jgi:hypothetical protein
LGLDLRFFGLLIGLLLAKPKKRHPPRLKVPANRRAPKHKTRCESHGQEILKLQEV